MSKEYKITIIMSNYNQEKYIKQAIESVISQNTDFEWQLIITDDNSTKDNSIDIIKEYERLYPENIVALYNKENGKYLKNVLRAKSITKTEYFCLLDADYYWIDNNYLQDGVDWLDCHKDFTIYQRNVICKSEYGKDTLFIPKNIKESDYTLEDYFNNNIVITQTVGAIFRNVIFKNGIPTIMTNAVNTISERSFEGDTDRFIMHIKYGKAHYNPTPSGVYRLLPSGIWNNLSAFEQHIINAQCYLDYNEYYEYKYNSFFMNAAYREFLHCVELLSKLELSESAFANELDKKRFFNVLMQCLANKDILTNQINECVPKLNRNIFRSVYNKLRKTFKYLGI